MTDETQQEAATETATETTAVAETTEQAVTPHQEFLSGLPEELRSNPAFIKFNGESKDEIVGKLANSYVNVQKLVGADKNAVLKFPSSEEDKDGWNEVYSKIGRPDEVDGYDLDKYKDAPGVQPDHLKELASVAHENGVSKAAFQGIVDKYFEQAGSVSQVSEQELEQTISGYTEQLKTEWGDAYEQKTNKILGTLKENATPEFLQLAADYPYVFDNPAVMKTFDNLIKMTSEDGGVKTAGSSASGALTPDEAKARIAAIHGDDEKMKILTTKGHPMRDSLIAERSKLFAAAYGNS